MPREGYDANRILACCTVQKIEIFYSNLRSIFRVVLCGVVNLSGNCPANYTAGSMTSANAWAVSFSQPGRGWAAVSRRLPNLDLVCPVYAGILKNRRISVGSSF